MPDHLGEDMRKTKNEEVKEEKDIKGKFFVVWYSIIQNVTLRSALLNSSRRKRHRDS